MGLTEVVKMNNKHEAIFDEFTIELTENDAGYMFHQGDCYNSVKDVLETELYISKQFENITNETLIKCLLGYGAWEESELLDKTENIIKILWLAAGDIVEEMEIS
jgi:hypothetical protein